MQAALRHAEHTALLPWQATAPDESLMAKEDGISPHSMRALLVEALFTYLFADSGGRQWEKVAVRVLVLMREFLPGLLVGRDMAEVAALKRAVMDSERYHFTEFVELARYEGWRHALEGVLGYLFPARRGWLFKGTRRTYLLARAFQPWLVKVDGKELTYEEMAEIFEGAAMHGHKARARARSRWSARVQALLRKPIEQSGGVVRLQFGKSSTAREAMTRSAQGNHNRKKK